MHRYIHRMSGNNRIIFYEQVKLNRKVIYYFEIFSIINKKLIKDLRISIHVHAKAFSIQFNQLYLYTRKKFSIR